jgi:hypothetical protein
VPVGTTPLCGKRAVVPCQHDKAGSEGVVDRINPVADAAIRQIAIHKPPIKGELVPLWGSAKH